MPRPTPALLAQVIRLPKQPPKPIVSPYQTSYSGPMARKPARKPDPVYTHKTITNPRRADYIVNPFPKIREYPTPPPQPTREIKQHQKRIFVPHSPLPMPWLGKAPTGTKPFDAADPPSFHVARTKTKNLPVYVEKQGTPGLRIAIRRVTGNKLQLARTLVQVFGYDENKVEAHPTSAMVLIRGGDMIERERLMAWLTKKGF